MLHTTRIACMQSGQCQQRGEQQNQRGHHHHHGTTVEIHCAIEEAAERLTDVYILFLDNKPITPAQGAPHTVYIEASLYKSHY